MIKKLIKLANQLDRKGLKKEADYLDSIIKKMAYPTLGPINLKEAIERCDEKCKSCNSAESFKACLDSCYLDIVGSEVDKYNQKIFTLKYINSGETIDSNEMLTIYMDECLEKYGDAVMMMDSETYND
jgi:hypothetical protein